MNEPQDGGMWLLLRHRSAEIWGKKHFWEETCLPDLLGFKWTQRLWVWMQLYTNFFSTLIVNTAQEIKFYDLSK